MLGVVYATAGNRYTAPRRHAVTVAVGITDQDCCPVAVAIQSGAWCTATASVYDASRNWNDVYVYSNQPDMTATVTADGWSGHYETDDSGYADVWLDGPPPGVEITVRVGGATCTASD